MARTFIRTTDLEDALITSAKLASSAVVTAALADLNVTTGKIADGAITTAKIAGAAVTEGKLGDGAVATAKIADSAVTEAKLASSAVTAAKIASGAVETAKLADDAVTQAKIADAAVGSDQLASGAVVEAKLADSAVTTAKINNLAVTEGKLADGAVATAKIASLAVTEAKLADGAVATAKLADNAVTAAKLADNAVDAAAIADGSVTTAKLAANAVTAAKADLSGSDWVFGQGRLKTTMAASPADNEVITKSYFDAYAQGVSWKQSVRVASIGNGNFDPTTVKDGDTFGGAALATGDRFLWFRAPTASTAAGVYVVGASASARASDFDAPNEIKGAAVFVLEGDLADSGFVCITDSIVLGTTPIAFTQFTGLGQITAGDGLTKTGNTLDVAVGNGIQISSDAVAVKLNATSPGLQVDGAGLSVKLNTNNGLDKDANGIAIKLHTSSPALAFDGGSGGIRVAFSSDKGLDADANGLKVKLESSKGLAFSGTGGIQVSAANGVQVDGGGFVSVKLNASNPALVADANGLAVLVDGADAIETSATGLKLKGASVTTAKLGDGAVTAAKLASNAVETAKIKDGAVTYAKLAADVRSAIGKFDFGKTYIATSGQTTFTLDHDAVASNFGGHMVYLNGRVQLIGSSNDYTLSAGTGASGQDQIVFQYALTAGDFVAVVYGFGDPTVAPA